MWRIARETCPVHCSIQSAAPRTGVVVMRRQTGQNVLEYEILQEQAATIGRLGRELQDALDALNAFDKRASSGKTAAARRDRQRARLVDDAAYALWHFVVQRECSGFGFRTTEQVLKEYAVPAEVRLKMGAVRPRVPDYDSALHATRAEVSTTSSRTPASAARISAAMVVALSPRCAGDVEPIDSARWTSVSTSIARRSITPKLSRRAKGESSRIASWRIQSGS